MKEKHLLPLLFLFASVFGEAFANNRFKEKSLLAQTNRQDIGSTAEISSKNKVQILKLSVPQKSLWQKVISKTSLNYYQQFLGPTLTSGNEGTTYNVFQEGTNSPGTGFAPWQSFHSLNLRYQLNTTWALGTTLSAVNGYTKGVSNFDREGYSFTNSGETTFFNSRIYLSFPGLQLQPGTLYTTLSYELPTSSISRGDDMRWGWIIAQSFAFKLPSSKWNLGIMGQIYRIYYKNNLKPPFVPIDQGGEAIPLQTLIVSTGPYANYRITDRFFTGNNFYL